MPFAVNDIRDRCCWARSRHRGKGMLDSPAWPYRSDLHASFVREEIVARNRRHVTRQTRRHRQLPRGSHALQLGGAQRLPNPQSAVCQDKNTLRCCGLVRVAVFLTREHATRGTALRQCTQGRRHETHLHPFRGRAGSVSQACEKGAGLVGDEPGVGRKHPALHPFCAQLDHEALQQPANTRQMQWTQFTPHCQAGCAQPILPFPCGRRVWG